MGAAEEKKPLLDASGREVEPEDSTATAILRRKKKDTVCIIIYLFQDISSNGL